MQRVQTLSLILIQGSLTLIQGHGMKRVNYYDLNRNCAFLVKNTRVNDGDMRFAQNGQTIHLFPPLRPYLVRIAGDLEGI
jgi:hypothetical protein